MFLLWLVVFTCIPEAWAVNCFAEKLRKQEEQVYLLGTSLSGCMDPITIAACSTVHLWTLNTDSHVLLLLILCDLCIL